MSRYGEIILVGLVNLSVTSLSKRIL